MVHHRRLLSAALAAGLVLSLACTPARPPGDGLAAIPARATALDEAAGRLQAADPDLARWIGFQARLARSGMAALAADQPAADDRQAQLERTIAAEGLPAHLDRVEQTVRWRSAPRPATAVILAADFGALGDGVADDGPAIRRAIAAALAHGGAEVRLGAGRFRIATLDDGAAAPGTLLAGCAAGDGITPTDLQSRQRGHLVVRAGNGLVIRGAGRAATELVMGCAWQAGVVFERGAGVEVADLAIDYDPLPFTQGRIVRIASPASYELAVDPGFPAPTAEHIAKANFLVTRYFSADAERPGPQGPTNLFPERITRVEGDVYRIDLRPSELAAQGRDATSLVPGQRVVVYGRAASMDAAVLFDGVDWGCARGVAVWSGPCLAFAATRSGLIEVGGCVVEPKPGSTRICSTDADGVFTRSCAVDPYIHDSSITRNGDDFFNFHSWLEAVAEAGPDWLQMHGCGFADYHPGDRIAVLGGGSGTRPKLLATVAHATVVRDAKGRLAVRLHLPEPLPAGAVEAGPERGGALPPDWVLNLSRQGGGGVVTANRLVDGFRCIARTPGLALVGNEIGNRYQQGLFLLLGIDLSCREGWRAWNVEISGNRIDGHHPAFLVPQAMGEPKPRATNAAITITGNQLRLRGLSDQAALLDGKRFDARYQRDVRIADNQVVAP